MRTKKLFLISAIAGAFLFGGTSASAHDVIPPAVREYLRTHPDATTEDIERFAAEETPDTAAQKALLDAITQERQGFLHNAMAFCKLGISHILSGPDHILFVLSLLLTFVTLRGMFKLTSSFTLAHSITLLLAGSGLVVLSSRIVEPMIAFSIAFVAFTTVFLTERFPRLAHNSAPTVFAFGLFHGLGFAGLLQEIHIPQDRFLSSLLFFNVGIEIGQLLIILFALPAIYLYKDRPWYPKAIRVAALTFTVVGLFWAIERIVT